jgi:hypothetical protein
MVNKGILKSTAFGCVGKSATLKNLYWIMPLMKEIVERGVYFFCNSTGFARVKLY